MFDGIIKKFTPTSTPVNEVDVVILNGSDKGIIECKFAHVTNNIENNVFSHLKSIIKKFNDEGMLESTWKNQYQKYYGQIKITNGAFQSVNAAQQFVNIVKEPIRNLLGNGDGNLFTIEELMQLEELHIIIGNKRIIIKPSNW